MANINGTNGNDQISGTNKNDVILAYAGNDVIDGGAGDDSINAGEGNNRVDGGSGNDTITAGAGNDVIDGGSGNDVINAGNGNNTVDGGSGNDTITTGSGNDVIEGDSGNDVISAGAGNDIVEGGEGNDRISGGEGNDQLYGDAGDDIIEGGSGDDFIDGGTGQDRLYGGEGNDTILGSSASDLIHGGAGNDIIGRDDDWWRYGRGESGSDIIYGDGLNYATDSAAAMAFGSDIIYSGNGNDTIYGDSGNNLSGSGAGGNDKIFAGRGDDKVYGEGGNDLIYGEDGDDLLDGGAGDDSIKGGDGRDTVYGGLGNDFISGADGRDLLYGGSGNDRIGNNDDSNWRHGYFSENGGDTIYGDGKDSAAGAAAAMGNDVIFSGLGNDTLYGDNGNNLNGAGAGGADTLYAGSGNDTVYGEGGDDELFGESGNDNLYGGAGADEIAGGLGIDTLSGGAGADTFVFTAALNQQDQHGQHGNGYPHNFGHHRGYDHDGQWSWSDSTGSAMDTVTDFKGINDTANLAEQDKIDLVQLLGDGVDLKWGGTTPTANGVWFKQLGGDTYVYADIGGNTTAELAIRLSGIHNLVAADFLGVTIPNSTPVLGDTNNPAAVAELANASAQNLSPISGNFTVTDMDVGNTLTPSIVGSPVVMLNGAAFVLPASANALIAAGAFSLIGATSNGGLVNIGYTYDPAAAHLDFLAAGQSLTITYTIKVSDGTVDSGTQDVIFTITGTNDAAVLSGATVNLTETNAVLNAGGTLTISDVDSAALFVAQAGTVGLYGSFSINPAGAWTYTASTAHDEFVAGTTYTDTFSVTSADGTLSAVTVTILGTNDIPVIGGVSAGAVTEDATSPNLTISGALTISDLDVDQASFVSQAGTLGSNGYGTFSVSAAGNWTYSAANGQIAIQALGAGDSLTDSFIVTSFDGSSSQVVTVTLQGTNDDPVLSVDTSGAVTEDAATPTLTDSGVLSFTDVDTTNTHMVSVSNNADALWSGGALSPAQIGALTSGFTADGDSWDYAVSNAATQFLALGETVTFSYDVTVTDNDGGSDTETVTLIITGTNDDPVLSVDTSGAVTEDAATPILTDSGVLSFTDVDTTNTHTVSVSNNADAVWSGGALSPAQIGALTSGFTADGDSWDYAVSNGATQFLALGETVTFSYDVTVTDNDGGSDTETVTITLQGTNDDPVLSVDTSGAVTEDAATPTLTDSGVLSFTDVDTTNTHMVSVSNNADALWSGGALSPAQIGALTSGFTADGDSWDYAVSNGATQFLALGETVTFSYDVTVTDNDGGSDTETVTLTITGTNDDPVLSVDASGAVTEDAATPILTDSGVLSFTDVDTTNTHTVSVSNNADAVWSGGALSPAQIGALTSGFTADSDSWDYAVSNAATQFLALGETVTFSYDVTVTDNDGGSATETVTITLQGTNDDPVLSVDTSGAVTEDAATPILTDSGTLSFTDVDTTNTHTVSVSNNADAVWSGGALSPAQIGALTSGFTADGDSWDYAVSNGATQFLALGETVTFSYAVTVTDNDGGSDTETVTLTITGTNDDPVLSVDTSGAVTEDAATPILTDSGTLSFTDVDTTNTHMVSVSDNADAVWSGGALSPAQIGALTSGFTADGDSWDYAVSNAATQFLAAGETVTFSYDVTVTDNDGGSATETVTITLQGTNDDPVLSVDASGAVTEDAATPILTDSGVLSFTDVDTTNTHTVSVSDNADAVWSGGALSPAQIGALTSGFTADSDSWDYAVSNAATQFLALGETVTFSYDVTVTDNDGGSDTETVTLTITGTNDDPVLSVDASGAVTEDAATPILTDSGVLSFTDVDTTNTHTVSVSDNADAVWSGGALSPAQIGALTSGFTADSDSWDYAVSNGATQFLALGETVTFSYAVTVTDNDGGSDTETVTLTITGTNDDPVLSVDTSGAVTEDAATPILTDSGVLSFTDVDTTNTHTVSVSNNADAVWSGGALSPAQIGALTSGFTADGDSWDYAVSNGATQFLALGETVTFSYDVTVTDNDGGSDTETVTITLQGTNDDPVLSVDTSGAVTEDAATPTLTDSGVLSFTDVDTTNTHMVSVSNNADALWSGGALSPAQIGALTSGFTADGDSWDYAVSNGATQFLALGETVTFSYDVTVTDNDGGSDTETVTLTITGTNDDPVLSVDASGAVTEDAATPILTDSGVLSFTDVDTTNTHTVSVSNNADAVWSGGALSPAQIGALTSGFTADSDSWDYAVSNGATQFLALGETVTFSYDVTVTDNDGGSATETVTITLQGTNDDPVLSVDASGAVTEDAATPTLTDSGVLSFTDVDTTNTHTVSVSDNADAVWSGGALSPAQIGALTSGFTADSDSWDYAVSNGATQFLALGETVTFSYDVTVTDNDGGSDTETVTLTITGTNDDPVLSVDTSGAVTEDAATPILTDSGVLSFTDVDTTNTHTVSVSNNADAVWSGGALSPAQIGALASGFTADGDSWDYAVSNAATQFLAAGETVTFSYAVTVTDNDGGSDTETVTLTITGTNDDPVLSVDTSGAVTEDAATPTLTDSGVLSFTDVDTTNTHTVSVSNNADAVWSGGALSPAQIGALTSGFTADGDSWDYAVSNAATQFLALGETVTFSYDVTVTDNDGGSATETVTITLQGTNDDPVLSVDTSGAVTEDAATPILTDSGVLSFTDVDTTNTHMVSVSNNADALWSGGALSPAQIGALTSGFTADGDSWDYAVSNAATQFLAAGETVTFSYAVTVTDNDGGSATETVTITLQGTNDDPVLSVDTSGAVTEDAASPTLTDSGVLSFTDVDTTNTHMVSVSNNADAVWSGGALSPAQIGALTSGFTADGDSWDYAVSNAATQFLAAGETVTFSYDVTVTDNDGGSDTETVTLTITGTNDDPVLSVDTSGAVTEDAATPILTDSGVLSFTDVDTTNTHTVSVSNNADAVWSGGALSPAQIGALTSGFTADGDSWDYAVSNGATQFLALGETVTFSYDVTVTDNDGGSDTETVTITLQGTNDAAVITGTGTAAVAEDTALVAGQLVASGDLDATDVDSAATFTVQTNVASAYGLFSIDASGAWSYKADNTHAAIQQLSNGGTLTDTIVVSTADGTTHNVVITINGTADASVIIAPDNLQYDPDSGDQTPFNRLMFVDADTTGSVTVTITRTSGDSSFSVTGAPSGGTAVGGNNATITGTIANINAWLAGNNLTHDSNGNDPDTFTIAINSGGSISSYVVSEATFTSTGNADTNNYAGVNVLAPTLNAGSGGDTVYTSWSHVGAAATNYTDDFVTGTDTIYLNFTATQLQEILTNATTRDDLQTFLFNADGNDLNLDATSWNATVSPSGYFEVANIGLANVWSTRDTVTPSNNYLDINTTWKGVIAANSGGTGEILGLTGTASAEMIIASGAGTVSGLAGNDVLVAQNSGNTLDGGANNDLLLGGTGADVLIGGAGGDMLAGGGGADTFKWGAEAAGVANADIIADYNFTEGDKLDLSSLLTGFQAGADVAKFVKLSVSGENLLVSVDTTGSGNFASGQTYTLIGANAQGAMPVKVVFGGYDHILSVDSSAPAAPSVPDLQVASDSGLSSTDNITSDNTPTVSGTSAEAGATVTLYDTNGTTVLGTTIAELDGSWTITSSTLTSGAHTLTAKVTDWAGNISPASAGLVVTIDTSVAAPVVSAVTADNGSSGTDEITNDTTLVINGTAEANSSVQVFRDGVSIGTTTANGSGNWSFDHTGTTLAQGNYNFTAQATDVAGNLSVVSAALPVTVDTSAPTVSAIVNQTPATAITNADSLTFRVTFGEAVANVSTGDFTVNGTTATVTGVSAVNANTYDVTISGGNLASLNGTVTLGFAGGQNITDIAGNALTATTPTGANNNSYTLDNTAAAPTALNLAAADDSGSSNSDNLTQNTSALTIDGAGENGATVTVFRDIDNDGAIDAGESLGTATVVGGVFSLDVSLAAGTHNIRAIQTDVAGNTSAASASGALNITVDISVAAPVVNNVTADNGSSGTDEITNDTTLIINGTAEANSSVQVFRDGVSIGTTTANGSGNWSFDHTGTTLAQGNYNFTAQATDVAGNVSAVSAALPVTIDTTAPTQTAVISTVTDNVSPVTGTLTSGGSTNDTSLALAGTYTGTLGAGEVVAVYDGATRLGTATASAGSWTYADSTLANGDSVSYTVRVEDVAGNQGTASAAFTTTIDMTAPTQTAVISTVTDNVSPVTGTLTSGGSTNDTSLALAGTYTGTLGAGEVIAVYDGATRLGTATASAGSWTYTDSTLANGDNVSYTVRIEDAAGNQGTASAAFTTTIDTLSPTATLNITAISTDSGTSSSDFITNDTSLTVSGSNMALGSGEKIQISSDGGTNWTDVTQNTSTSWSLIDGISHGSNFTYQARVVDAAGNVGNTDSRAVTIDTNAPTGTATISTVTDNVLPVTGTLANGASTNDTTLALTGTSTQGSGQAIGIFDGGVLIGTTTTTSGGAWSFTTSALVEGAHSLTAALIDTAGNGNLSAAFGVTVDTTAPASPSITLVTDNVGTIQGDVADNGFTNDTSLVVRVSLSGTGALAGNTVQLSNNTTALGGAVTLSGANITNGYVDITTPALTNGTSYNLRAAVTDTAGNAGALSASGARDITVDTAAPAVTGGLGNLYSNTDNLFTLSGVTDATGVASVSVHDNGNDVADFSLSLSSGSATNGTWTASGNRDAMNGNSVTITLTDMAGNVSTITGTAPAGTAGEPIHLALAAPAGHADVVMLTIAGVPQGWTLSEGTDNGDGTWTVVTDDPSSLTVTTAADFAGAMVLPVHMSWTNADGSTGSSTVLDNVEAYAPGSPIFALSQDDNLSGSAGADTFVFAQPIAHNQVYGFDVAADRLDLIGFGAGLDFASLQIADDGQGNAVVTLGPDSSITLRGVDSTALSAANVVFDLAPELSNAGEMVIHDGAMLPLGGFLDNSGRVVLDSHGQTTRLEVLVEHLTLRGGGQVVLSDNPNNLIVGSSSQARLVNENNSISGAGQIGAGQMALLNASLILANGLHALELDTGNNVIGNSGTLESTGAGGMTVASAVENSGHLWANGGDLRLLGDVTGSGSATIDGDGTLSFAGAAHIGSLAFHGDGAGTLVVGADEAASLGTILGLEQDDELLLGDLILGADTRLSYSANAHGTGGLLTVTDGVQSAELHLLGHYSEGDFLLTDDAEGGVRVGYGGASSGTLVGTLQDDDLQGGAGNDILAGRAGSDALHGGGGADSFVWLQGDTHAGEVTRDYVADFNQGEGDRLDLSDLLDHDGSKSVDDLKSLLSMVQDTDGIHLQVKDTTTHQVTQDIVLANHTFGSMTGDSNSTASQVLDYMLTNHRLDIDNP